MVIEKDIKILKHLRKNARQAITNISKETGIPVTTVYDRIKANNDVIKKHTTLLDFNKLGYNTVANIVLKTNKEDNEKIENFIIEHPSTNSFYKLNYGYDYLIESIFKNPKEVHLFVDELEKLGILEKHVFIIIDEILKEEFFTK